MSLHRNFGGFSKMNKRRFILGFIGAVVIATVFMSIFTDFFKLSYGIMTAVIILILGGIVAKIWGIKE